MKRLSYLLILCTLLASCKKGKKLPHEVPVQFITLSDASVYPEDHFPPFNPYDFSEAVVSPKYAHDYSTSQIAERFNKDLIYHLNKNNVTLQTDTAGYVLKIGSIHLGETIERQSYIDSCGFNYPLAYVYASSLRFSVSASLYKNGVFIKQWIEEGKSSEHVKTEIDDCNKPKVSKLLRGPNWLINQVAKEIRVRVSKELYLQET